VDVERIVDGEVPPRDLDKMTVTLRDTLGPGRASVFDGQLTWRTDDTGGSAAHTVEVTVTSRGGRTRLRLTEWRRRVRGRIAAGGVGLLAGGSLGSILGFMLSGGNAGLAQLLMVAGMIAGVVVFTRAATIMDTEHETDRLNALADRLVAASHAIRLPAAAPPESPAGTPRSEAPPANRTGPDGAAP
jgi:hypothetical protein